MRSSLVGTVGVHAHEQANQSGGSKNSIEEVRRKVEKKMVPLIRSGLVITSRLLKTRSF